MAYSDRELLARLIQCEAGGEGENGMKAVAGVVMNRVNATGGEYARVGQGSIRSIIFQPYQFVCASETEGGVYNPQNIYNMQSKFIMILRTGPLRATGCRMWRNRCGSITRLALPAGPFSRRMWGIGRPESAITAFIIRRMPIIELKGCCL